MIGAFSYVAVPGGEAVAEVATLMKELVKRVADEMAAGVGPGGQASTPSPVDTERTAVLEDRKASLAAKYEEELSNARSAEAAAAWRRGVARSATRAAEETRALEVERGRALEVAEQMASTPEQMAALEAAACAARVQTALRSIEDPACERSRARPGPAPHTQTQRYTR